MGKESEAKDTGRWKNSVKAGLAASGFITAIIVVIAVCFVFGIDMATVGIVLAIAILVLAGIPLAIFAIRGDRKSVV